MVQHSSLLQIVMNCEIVMSMTNLQILKAGLSHLVQMMLNLHSRFWDGEIYMQNHIYSCQLRSNCIQVGQAFLEIHQ